MSDDATVNKNVVTISPPKYTLSRILNSVNSHKCTNVGLALLLCLYLSVILMAL